MYMDINELLALKAQLASVCNQEQENLRNSNSANRQIIEDEIREIVHEQNKVAKLIEIYKNNDKDYIIMKLERLYMILLLGITEDKFNKLDENDIFRIFDKYFPDEWIFINDLEQKENLLLDAICSNKVIDISQNKKYLLNGKKNDE